MGVIAVVLSVATLLTPTDTLYLELVGNAGVVLSDGEVSLLVDLPYESGAFGYQEYSVGSLQPRGQVVSVITHAHTDHFDAGLWRSREPWRVMGPPSVVAGLPPDRVLRGDSVRIGSFDVVALRTPHTPDHQSYRLRWRGRVVHATGDTEDPSALEGSPDLDVLFITPWLSCAAAERGIELPGRSIAYHLRPDGGDRLCAGVTGSHQGTRITLSPASPAG
ncbi:MAG: MBL fold metallo-hydrolase [Gemmatimonadota bacterium]